MMNKRNILIGIVIIVFGLVFVPRVIDRVKNNDISRSALVVLQKIVISSQTH